MAMAAKWQSVLVAAGVLLVAAGAALPARADTFVWTGTATGGDGITWGDPKNWTNDTTKIAGVLPTAADTIHLSGATVHVTSTAAMSAFASSSSGNLQINNGGNLTIASSGLRWVSPVVNSGGVLNLNPNMESRSNLVVNAGGELIGLKRIGNANDSRSLSVYGKFNPLGSSDTNKVFYLGPENGARGGKVRLMDPDAQLTLDVFGNGNNESFFVNSHSDSELTLNTGTVYLRPVGGYEFELGHTFDLWDVAENSLAVLNVGDGSNIFLWGSPYKLDTSEFATTGVVTVVPEPAGLAGAAVGGLLLFRRRRR